MGQMMPLTNLEYDYKKAINFCDAFKNSTDRPKFIFGRNEYARSIASLVQVDGFIDDFTIEREYCGCPVLKTEAVPKHALAVSVVVGKPSTAKKRLEDAGIEHLDYFTFYRYSGLPIKPVTCWNDFAIDFESNRNKYEWIFSLLCDAESRTTFRALINFRLSGNLSYMDGFTDRQNQQYFEDFLSLSKNGEVFVDVGGFDGNSSLEFAKHYPEYKAIHFFEPEKKNMIIAAKNLKAYHSIKYYEIGLSDKKGVVRFSVDGSKSRVDDHGELKINTDRLDNIICDSVSYIKMDIEGAEPSALAGAWQTIGNYYPTMAVCVYHRGDDFWRIPQQILAYRHDYDIYLRHYTEGVDETVMYFVPK